MSLSWSLPSSPDHRLYRELEGELLYLAEEDPKASMILFRAVAETDLWFFQKYVSSLGSFRIGDKYHPRLGGLYVDERWFFDRMREVQEDFEARRNRVWYKWFRFSFKTTAICQHGSLWLLCRNPMETIAIFTHKVTQVGESMGGVILDEIKNNQTLRAHWPQFRTLKEASVERITLDRDPGPKEPSISIHPILGSATSGHYTWIFNDDAVNDVIIESKKELRKVDKQLNRQEPLRHDDTPIMFLGTVWGPEDPMVKREREGYFSKVSHQPAFLPGNIPQLRSREFFNDKRAGIRDEFEWNAQYLLKLVSRGVRYFRDEWRQTYPLPPKEMAIAAGGQVVFIVDPAGGGEDSDFTTVRIFSPGFDRKFYNLDLWREHTDEVGLEDLLFGARSTSPSHYPEEGLVPRWKKVDAGLQLWVEEFGASIWVKTLKREAERRKIHVTIRELPKLNRSKADRIRFLQNPYREGRIVDPPYEMKTDPDTGIYRWTGGFGHGSADDPRDTLCQYFKDEFELWSASIEHSSADNDDCLDCMAWPLQPEVIDRLPWPFFPGFIGGLDFLQKSPFSYGNDSHGVMPSQVSPWAY